MIIGNLLKHRPRGAHQIRAPQTMAVQQNRSVAAGEHARCLNGNDGFGLVEVFGIAAGEQQAGELIGDGLGQPNLLVEYPADQRAVLAASAASGRLGKVRRLSCSASNRMSEMPT